jgi:hypothetical protein
LPLRDLVHFDLQGTQLFLFSNHPSKRDISSESTIIDGKNVDYFLKNQIESKFNNLVRKVDIHASLYPESLVFIGILNGNNRDTIVSKFSEVFYKHIMLRKQFYSYVKSELFDIPRKDLRKKHESDVIDLTSNEQDEFNINEFFDCTDKVFLSLCCSDGGLFIEDEVDVTKTAYCKSNDEELMKRFLDNAKENPKNEEYENDQNNDDVHDFAKPELPLEFSSDKMPTFKIPKIQSQYDNPFKKKITEKKDESILKVQNKSSVNEMISSIIDRPPTSSNNNYYPKSKLLAEKEVKQYVDNTHANKRSIVQSQNRNVAKKSTSLRSNNSYNPALVNEETKKKVLSQIPKVIDTTFTSSPRQQNSVSNFINDVETQDSRKCDTIQDEVVIVEEENDHDIKEIKKKRTLYNSPRRAILIDALPMKDPLANDDKIFKTRKVRSRLTQIQNRPDFSSLDGTPKRKRKN